jgi:hypothetical protein
MGDRMYQTSSEWCVCVRACDSILPALVWRRIKTKLSHPMQPSAVCWKCELPVEPIDPDCVILVLTVYRRNEPLPPADTQTRGVWCHRSHLPGHDSHSLTDVDIGTAPPLPVVSSLPPLSVAPPRCLIQHGFDLRRPPFWRAIDASASLHQ